MRRIDVLAITIMVVMTIIWIPGCPREDLIDQGQTVVVPDQVQEPTEPPPAEVAPADPAPDAAAGASGSEAQVAAAPAEPAAQSPAGQPEAPAAGPSSAAPSAAAPASSPEPTEPAEKPAPAPTAPAADEGTVVIGRISVASHVPEPSEVPYTDCLTMVKYTVESVEGGSYGEKELLAAFWGMRGAKLQPAAKFQVGQRHRLVIEPLANHPDLSRAMQADDTNEYSLTPQWVVRYSAP